MFSDYGKVSLLTACFSVMLVWIVNTQAKWNTSIPRSDFLVVHLLANFPCLPHPYSVALFPSIRFFKMFISRSSFLSMASSCLASFTLVEICSISEV